MTFLYANAQECANVWCDVMRRWFWYFTVMRKCGDFNWLSINLGMSKGLHLSFLLWWISNNILLETSAVFLFILAFSYSSPWRIGPFLLHNQHVTEIKTFTYLLLEMNLIHHKKKNQNVSAYVIQIRVYIWINNSLNDTTNCIINSKNEAYNWGSYKNKI